MASAKPKIDVLDRLVADQIAAGEVVERPGSVVKELVENSLDAGATKIQLDIEGGGVRRLRVLDDGEGIGADDLEKAFLRHATSKIRRLADLDGVRTYGFRGEALPSIASVSKISVRTRTEGDVGGTLLELEAGEVVQRRQAGCPVGTEIDVRELFFNTPARLKFLKKETTEASHCGEALVRLAALRPDVSFKMTSNGRTVRSMPRVERTEERVMAMFGKETLVRSQGSDSGIEVLAILGPPERARAGAGSLYTYVNRRYMRDKTLLAAVTQAFAGTLEHGRYPVGLVALEMPEGSFDVNVHPQKTEVRFADSQAVYGAVRRVVGEMVSRAIWSFSKGENSEVKEPRADEVPENPFTSRGGGTYKRKLIAVPQKGSPFGAPRPVFANRDAAAPEETGKGVTLDENEGVDASAEEGDSAREERLFLDPRGPQMSRGDKGGAVGQLEWSGMKAARAGRGRFSELRYIGQGREMFLLMEDEDDLVVMDQHAAHERVTFEKLRGQLTGGGVKSQKLLMPQNLDLGPAEAERICEMSEELMELGLEIARSGPDRVAIHAVPAELVMTSPERLLADMVIALEEGRQGSRGDAHELALATMACHSSIRGGRQVARSEVDALLEQLDGVENAGHCPHGRPILARIPWKEIRRRVGRG